MGSFGLQGFGLRDQALSGVLVRLSLMPQDKGLLGALEALLLLRRERPEGEDHGSDQILVPPVTVPLRAGKERAASRSGGGDDEPKPTLLLLKVRPAVGLNPRTTESFCIALSVGFIFSPQPFIGSRRLGERQEGVKRARRVTILS